MSPVMLLVNGFVVLLIPLVIVSMVNGRLPADTTWIGRLYRAEPRLPLISNLFVLALSGTCVVRLGVHFGLIAPEWKDVAEAATTTAFMFLWGAYVAVFVIGVRKLRRARSGC